jgi:hypothetical protein
MGILSFGLLACDDCTSVCGGKNGERFSSELLGFAPRAEHSKTASIWLNKLRFWILLKGMCCSGMMGDYFVSSSSFN